MSNADQLEATRLFRLAELGILDSPDDASFLVLAEQALSIVPSATIAGISLVAEDRQWFKAIVGLTIKETPRSVSFCAHTIQTSACMVVVDAAQDERFAANPLVTSGPMIRSYAGVKLMNGVGALCVIGSRPYQPTQTELSRLGKLARFVDIQLLSHGTHFNLGRRARDDQPGEAVAAT